MRFLTTLLLFSIFCGTVGGIQKPGTRTAQPGQPAKPSQLPGDMLWWLPENTETVMAQTGPYDFAQSFQAGAANFSFPTDTPSPDDLEAIFRICFSFSEEEKRLADSLAGVRVLAALEGSRGFRAPKALGLMPFEGCHITIFDREINQIQANLPQILETEAKRIHDFDGIRVAEVERNHEADLWHYYLTFPRPNVLVCATDEGYLRDVLARMKTRAAKRALPADLPEWKQVDTAAPFWAVRHFSRQNHESDLSSPFYRHDPEQSDEEAVGLTFSFDPRQTDTPTVKYLSNSKRILEIATKEWTAEREGLTPSFRQTSPGVVQISPRLSRQSFSMFILIFYLRLGHGVFL